MLLLEHDCSGASSGHSSVQSPCPGQVIWQGPAHANAQLPLPVHAPVLPGPIAAVQLPEPVQSALHESAQMKSQLPEPAHCRSQSAVQSIEQSPLAGQIQSFPEHSQWPSSHSASGPRQPTTTLTVVEASNRPRRSMNPRMSSLYRKTR